MDKKQEINKLNQKLFIIFLMMLTIFATLFVTKTQAMNVSSEIESLKQNDWEAPTYITYEDLVAYYDILCCQRGTPLPHAEHVRLTGSHSQGSFDYDLGRWKYTGLGVGSQLENHRIYSPTNDFDSSSYQHRTYGYFEKQIGYVARPKEAYIVAEMKKELDIAATSSSFELIYENGQPRVYTGSLINSIPETLSTGETAYAVNQKYVLETPEGNYYVKPAKDSEGNAYYVYETGQYGSLVEYEGDFTYIDPRTGTLVNCIGVPANNVYYEHNGEISSGDTVAASSGTLYLVRYDMIVDIHGALHYCSVTNDYNYIQIAWWTTYMGTNYGTVTPSVPNSLAVEAAAFEDYILTITKASSVEALTYEEQSYDFYEEDGTHSVGSVMAPVIDYRPDFNRDDPDQNEVEHNEADKVTVSFNSKTQTFIAGPLSVDYVKEAASIAGRQKVDFSIICGVKLTSNIGELEFGKDWRFLYLADQGRDLDEDYPYPNPNEVFYLEINYIENLTELYELTFDFKYMNAGAELDIFDGYYNDVTWTVKYVDTTHEEPVYDEDHSIIDYEEVFDYRDIWIECTSVEPHDAQTTAHALIGARWYNYTSCSINFGRPTPTLTIEKVTLDETGEEIIPIDETFYFRIYINGSEYKEVSLTTVNGRGKLENIPITCKNPMTYRVEEIGNHRNNGPWEGTFNEENEKVVIEAENYIEPEEGKLRINKKLLNATPALETEYFYFVVEVTGRFSYNNGPIEYYNSRNPLRVFNRIETINGESEKVVRIHGAGEWESETFKWYGASPKYKVKEIIPNGATYELVSGSVFNGIGDLRDGIHVTATAINAPTTDWTILEVDKRMVSETKPQPGEVFKAHLEITGEFSYNGDSIRERTEAFDIILNQYNDWHWKSEEIVWNEGDVPTYTISEYEMAEGTSFVSISDERKSSHVNNFKSRLNPAKTLVVITNDREETYLSGRIQINKLFENSSTRVRTATFEITIKSKDSFIFRNRVYTNEEVTYTVSITVPANQTSATWLSEEDIVWWREGDATPSYTVTETEISDGEFISISNGTKTITSSRTITGKLNGKYGRPAKVIITCINGGNSGKDLSGHIVIIKESEDESIDDFTFHFKVTVTGTFIYCDAKNPDGTVDLEHSSKYTNATMVLKGELNGVTAHCGGEDWVSELIIWNENDPAPRYTIEEVSIPSNIEFVSLSNRDKTTSANYIDGVLASGTEENYITCINKPGPNFQDGSLRIVKKATEDLSGRPFYFTLEIKGEFDYAGKHYGPDSENGNTYRLEHIEVEANGNPWLSGIVTWNEEADAPTYSVTEETTDSDVTFVSISNQRKICTDSSRTITDELSIEEVAKIVAINYGEQPNGSHIEITKEVLNNQLKGRNFYFNVQVTSTSPFRYHDLEDVTKITEYQAGEIAEFKGVVAVADERDWVSGYFEWDEGAAVPTYTISEITGVFPDKVKTVSIRNDREIILKELDNTSGENLVIEGSLVGDMTHIIAVNDAKEETPVEGNIIIEKQAISEIIEGEEFTFTLTVTGKFKYQGKDYKKLEIKDIKITANGPVWSLKDNTGDTIHWYEKDGAPTYTVTEETATLANGIEFVSIRNAYQTNTQPAITGTVQPNFDNWIIAENKVGNPFKGRIQIYKTLLDSKGNQIDGVEFTFKVKVTFYDKAGNVRDTQEDEIKVTSGGYWRSGWYVWSPLEKTPTYEITEVSSGGYKCTIDKPKGDLIAQNSEDGITGIASVQAINVYEEEHQAQIRVNKHFELNDKLSEDDITVSFSALVKVRGSFTYKGKAYHNQTLTLKITLLKDFGWTWLSDVIRWNGDQAPSFIVEEPASEIPTGWSLLKTEVSPTNNQLVDGEIAVADITNEWHYNEQVILVMKLGGKVWDDTNRTIDKHVDSQENGIIDEGEPGIANAKVTIYRTLVDKDNGRVIKRLDGVYAYDESNLTVRIDNVTYTDDSGNWSFGAISVPAFTTEEKESGMYGHYDEENRFIADYGVTYDVEFEYDGQTYEPTEFLATAGGQSNSYVGANSTNNMYSDISNRWSMIINSTTFERDQYLYDSMAIDKQDVREEFNNTFADIQGKEVMDDDGNTLGTTRSGKELHYSSVDSVSFFNSDNSRKISTLETLDENGEIYEDLRISNCTANANLTFPFYTQDPNYDVTAWHLMSWDKSITDVFTITYKFEAVYNYCLSINLGLVEREAADIAVEKDLSEALVIVNGKALKYKFNTAIDLEDPDYTELLYKQLAVADAQIEYKLSLYKGDYYYRAAVYGGSDAGNALENFYTAKLGLPVETSEMEIYLKYTINVYNQSETYDVIIGEVADYYDNTFKLIEASESRYVQTLNGKDVDSVIEVASPSKVEYAIRNSETGSWEENGNGNVTWVKVGSYEGSDGITYGKLTTSSFANKKLVAGEKATITVTFKIEKDDVGDSGVYNTIKLGKKHNVAELTKFTSYYSDKSENRWSAPGQISGRVDEDSAPDNVNIPYYNEKTYYEDDTDSAPIITIGLEDETRAISGIVWDDAQTKAAGYGQIVGDGYYNPDQGDKLVDGITTEIYETISIPETTDNGETVYREYQFAWPTETPIAALGSHTISELTGFHQATVTQNGEYEFINPPAGNYRVRYVYGDTEILTGKTGSEEVYNGQDYKTTAYQIGFDNDKDNDGYVDNEWHAIEKQDLNDLRVNDARDNEARRLYISAKSEMLTHDNTKLLATADDKNADHGELFGNYQDVRNNPIVGEGYYMYAETAKINLGIENIYKIGYTTETLSGVDVGAVYGDAVENGRDVGTPDFTYHIKNIDCGIEERSQAKLTIDKQIKQITLTTSDNKVILDAIYDIRYTLKSDGSIASTVTLNEAASTGMDHIASLNRRGAYDQGYRYIIAEGTILQGTQIQVKYQFTIFNMSETDRISQDLETLWATMNAAATKELKETAFNEALEKISTTLYTESKGRVYKDGTNFTSVGYGTYFGSVYYLGSQGVGVRPDERIVKTEVHQLIDYIDPDVEFTDMNNIARDSSWTNTEIDYLLSEHLLDPTIVQIIDSEGNITGETAADRTLNSGERYSIVNDKLQEYRAEMKNNLVLMMDNGASQDTGSNPGFVKFLEPYMANKNVNRSTGSMTLLVSRFYSSELDAADIDNLVEIIKFENTAGRRDSRNIAGNANPYDVDGIYAAANKNGGKEKDASATEVITLSPPTGLNAAESRKIQLMIVILISITLVAISIVIIKKKVLVKN